MTIWNLAAIRQEVRDLTGRKTANQMAEATVDRYINEYYTLVMPNDLDLEELQEFWTKDTVAGVETVALDDEVLYLRPPYTIGGYPLAVQDDPARFYELYPKSGEPYAPGRPEAALYQGRSLILRPGPDDVYEVHAPAAVIPAALAGAGAPTRDMWGRLIVLGAAILIYASFGQRGEAEALGLPYEGQRALVQRPYLKKMQDYRGQPRF
jgi:hypothetical protein